MNGSGSESKRCLSATSGIIKKNGIFFQLHIFPGPDSEKNSGSWFKLQYRMKGHCYLPISTLVSPFANFLVTTREWEMPSLSQIFRPRSGCEEPENIFMFGILKINPGVICLSSWAYKTGGKSLKWLQTECKHKSYVIRQEQAIKKGLDPDPPKNHY